MEPPPPLVMVKISWALAASKARSTPDPSGSGLRLMNSKNEPGTVWSAVVPFSPVRNR